MHLNVSVRLMLWGVISLMMRIYYDKDKMITNTFSFLSLVTCHLICPFHFEVLAQSIYCLCRVLQAQVKAEKEKKQRERKTNGDESEWYVHYSEHLLFLGHNVCLKKKNGRGM